MQWEETLIWARPGSSVLDTEGHITQLFLKMILWSSQLLRLVYTMTHENLKNETQTLGLK